MNGRDWLLRVLPPALALAVFALAAEASAQNLSAWTTADWPADGVAVALDTEEGTLAVEAYAGGRHRAVAQHVTVERPTEVGAIAFRVARARSGVAEAQLAVTLREVPADLAPERAVDAGRVVLEATTRLPAQVDDNSVLGFTFEPLTLQPGRAYLWQMRFVEAAPLRSLGLSAGRFRGSGGQAVLSENHEPWKQATGRSYMLRLYTDLDPAAITPVPPRLDDLPARPMSIQVEPRTSTTAEVKGVAVSQPAYAPDLFNVHGIWHGGGGEQQVLQTFTWPGERPLRGVELRVRDYSPPFHGGAAGAPLCLAVMELGDDGRPGDPVAKYRGDLPERLRHSATLTLELDGLVLRSGQRYGLQLWFPEPAMQRHLSLSGALGDPYPAGRLLSMRNGGPPTPMEDGEMDLTFSLLADPR